MIFIDYALQTFNIRRVWSDNVEDVDEHKEESDQHGHSTRNNFWRNEEAGPGDHNEETRWEIIDVEILEHVTWQYHLYT